MTPAHVESRYIEVGEFRIHSVHAGAGDDVVLLHGLAGSQRWWRHSLEALARVYRVHVPELVGFGASRRTDRQPHLPELAGIIRDWCRAAGIARAHVAGHLMGGQIASHIAADAPELVRRLVLVCAAGVPRPLARTELARLVAELVPPAAWGRKLFLPTVALDAARAGPRVLWQATRSLLADDVRPLLSRIAAPTLVIWGERDPLTPLAHGTLLAASIPGARLVVLAHAAHVPMVDRPQEFNRVLLGFLAGDA